MLFSSVQETTTTTGTGNITLDGASENARTFTSKYSTNDRFNFYIDDRAGNWEERIGYLSGSTTLVRELLVDSSTGSAVNFAAGTKYVYVGTGACNTLVSSPGFSSLGTTAKYIRPGSAIRPNTTRGLTADRIHYVPFLMPRCASVDTIGVGITTGNGSAPPTNTMIVGLYDTDPNTGEAGSLLFEATGLDPSSTGVITGTFTEQYVQAGWYYAAVWSDASPTVRASDASIAVTPSFQLANNNTFQISSFQYIDSQTITNLPATGDADSALVNAAVPIVILGHS